MGLFGFGRVKQSEEALLTELIEHNADQIAASEGKDRSEATYLAICLVLDDLMSRENGRSGYQAVMGLLQTRYVQHMNEVMTYLMWSAGKIILKPEFEAEMVRRHQ